MVYESILDLVGNTPIVRLNNIGNGNIYVKLERTNPAGSIKDRAVYNMVSEMEKNKELTESDVLIEATSGNTGIALSMIGKIKGYRVIIVMPENMSVERIQLMKAYGAEIILTDKEKGMPSAIEKANQLLSLNPNYKSLKQFDNLENYKAHYKTTGKEILDDIKDIDIFTCAVGTGGTFTGISTYLKENKPGIKTVAIEPKSYPHKIQGIGAGFIPKNYNKDLADETILVTDEEAFSTIKKMADKEGILIGISSGANIYGALKLSEKYPDKKIVTVAPDGIDKYISMEIF